MSKAYVSATNYLPVSNISAHIDIFCFHIDQTNILHGHHLILNYLRYCITIENLYVFTLYVCMVGPVTNGCNYCYPHTTVTMLYPRGHKMAS